MESVSDSLTNDGATELTGPVAPASLTATLGLTEVSLQIFLLLSVNIDTKPERYLQVRTPLDKTDSNCFF